MDVQHSFCNHVGRAIRPRHLSAQMLRMEEDGRIALVSSTSSCISLSRAALPVRPVMASTSNSPCASVESGSTASAPPLNWKVPANIAQQAAHLEVDLRRLRIEMDLDVVRRNSGGWLGMRRASSVAAAASGMRPAKRQKEQETRTGHAASCGHVLSASKNITDGWERRCAGTESRLEVSYSAIASWCRTSAPRTQKMTSVAMLVA